MKTENLTPPSQYPMFTKYYYVDEYNQTISEGQIEAIARYNAEFLSYWKYWGEISRHTTLDSCIFEILDDGKIIMRGTCYFLSKKDAEIFLAESKKLRNNKTMEDIRKAKELLINEGYSVTKCE